MSESLVKIVDTLLERQKLEKYEDCLSYKKNTNKQIAELKCLNVDSEEERYLLIDLKNIDLETSKEFDVLFNLYNIFIDEFEKINEEDSIIAVMGFSNRSQEKKIYNSLYDKLSVAKERKKLKNIFDRKISIYLDLSEVIELEYFDEINYLENKVKTEYVNLQGNVYNICLYELNKLFDVTGEDLFVKNVRLKIKSNRISNKLKNNFKSYILVYLYEKLLKNNPSEKKELLEFINSNYKLDKDLIKYNSPEMFWFCHNGITIFSYDEKDIVILGNKIKLNPRKVSVINGAQTLTNFFDCLNEIKRKISSELENIAIDYHITKEEIEQILDDSAKKIIVKTIIIKDPEDYVSPITYGLNTQIPVKNEDILSNSNNIKKLNDYLKYGQIEILRPGQESIYKYGCDVLEYVKKYKMCVEKPGESKNFNKKDLEETIEESVDYTNNKKNDAIKRMTYLFEIDDWWRNSRKERENLIEPDDKISNCLLKYGKNYFCSYYLNEQNKKYYDDEFSDVFVNFINDMKKIIQDNNIEINANTFKNDLLFNEYKNYKQAKEKKAINQVKLITDDLNKLKEYLNTLLKSTDKNYTYKMSSIISKYFERENIDIRHFRIIKTDNKKSREAYPFPSSGFTEICMPNEELEGEYKKYEDSSFCKQVKSDFPLFVLDYEENIIKKIYFNDNFSFKEYSNQAGLVYNKTINAFEKGDESLFPRMGDDEDFHVRPKAKNADDTFEFTNGNQITKRTFWANKKLINKIIEDIDDNTNSWYKSD